LTDNAPSGCGASGGTLTAPARLLGRCHAYASSIYIIEGGAKYLLHDNVCPVVRATYPVPWMWRASNAVLGWAAGDATPGDGNCQERENDDWLCSALGSGFIIAEVQKT